MRQNVVLFWEGMCILFEICGKRSFEKCMGWGGGVDDHILEQMELQSARCTRQGNAQGTIDYSESESSSAPNSVPSTLACMLDIFLQINVNACGQKLLL